MRGTRYIPYADLPAAAFDIPGVRRTRKTNTLMVPWHAVSLVSALGYANGFKVVLGKRVESPLAYSADPIADHPFVSDEMKARATPVQREDLRKALTTSGGILDWPTGSGKTLLGLGFATAFGLAQDGGPRTLIVTPSTTTEQWRRQAMRWLDPRVKVGIVSQGQPTARKRKAASWELAAEGVRALARSGAPGALTLALKARWEEAEVSADELALLRRAKAKKVLVEDFVVVDDLGAVIAGPFETRDEAENACGTWTPGDYDVLVVGWGILPQDGVREALLAWAPKVLVIDEAHRLGKQGSMWRKQKTAEGEEDKEPVFERKTGAAANLHQISAEKAAAVLLMTATPQGDLPRNWHTLLDMYDPYSFGSFSEFGVRYCGGHRGDYSMVYDGLSHADELRARLSQFWYYRSKTETHKGLPAVRREFVTIDLRHAAAVDMAALGAELRDGDAGGSPTAMQIAVATEQKIPWAVDRLKEHVRAGQRAFVWVALRANARRLEQELQSQFDCAVYRADGTLTSVERANLVDTFVSTPDGVPAIMIGTIAAFSEAIDGLQHVDVALVLTVPWTPQLLIQGPEGRHSRIGGTRNVLLIYTRLAGTIDDRIWSRMGEKLGMVAEVRNDQDARELGSEISGDSPEAQARALAEMAGVLEEWQGASAAWKDYERMEAGVEGINDVDLGRLG